MAIIYLSTIIFGAGMLSLILFYGKRSMASVSLVFSIIGCILWTLSIWLFPYSSTPLFWARLSFVSQCFIPGFILTFIFNFPKKLPIEKYRYLYGLWVIPILISLISISPLVVSHVSPNYKLTYGFGHKLIFSYIFSYYSLILYLVYKQIQSHKGLDKRRLNYIFLGIFLTILYGGTTNLVFPLLGISTLSKFGPLGLFFYISFFSYAILKFQLMDIHIIIKKSIFYLALISSMSIIFMTSILLFGQVFDTSLTYLQVLKIIFSAGIIVFVYPHLKSYFDQLTDAFFFKNAYNYPQTLKDISHTLSTLIDLNDILSILGERVPKEMKIQHAYLYLKENAVFILKQAYCNKNKPTLSKALGTSLESLSSSITKLDIEEMIHANLHKNASSFLTKIHAFLNANDAHVVIPIFNKDELTSVLFLGSKLSEELYSKKDLSLLDTLAHQCNTAIQNARFYQHLQDNIYHLSSLNTFAKNISESFNLTTFREELLKTLHALFNTENALLYTINPMENDGHFYSTDPLSKSQSLFIPKLIKISMEHPYIVLNQSETLRQLGIDKNQLPKSTSLHPYCLFPLMSSKMIIGVVLATMKVPLKQTHLLSTLLQEASSALDNALLYRQILDIKNYNEEILKNLSNGVITTDDTLKITSFNYQAECLTGLSVTAALHQPIQILLPLSSKFDIVEKTKKTRTPHTTECTIDQNGPSIPISITTSLLDPNNNDSIIIVISDLTSVKNLQQEVEQANRLSSLGTMASGIAHEIKNPLLAIKTFSQMVPNHWKDPLFRTQYSDIVTPQINRINSLCQSLLRLGKPKKPEVEDIEINAIIQDVIALLEGERKQYNAAINTTYGSCPTISADPSQITQVFVNLLINALQALPQPEGGQISISSAVTPSGYIAIILKDTGLGISKEGLKKLFDPFYSTKKTGTGLGLSIVYKIMEEHHSKIKVSSQPNKGSTFCLFFPTKTARPNMLEEEYLMTV